MCLKLETNSLHSNKNPENIFLSRKLRMFKESKKMELGDLKKQLMMSDES